MNVCYHVFGCRLNRAEALDEQARYLAHGDRIVNDHASANMIVVRGCAVTSRAESEVRHLIDHLRRKYPLKKVRLTGCIKLSEADAKVNPAPPSAVAEEGVPTSTARAFLKVQDGCSGSCAYCIVPSFRAGSVSEPRGRLLDRARKFIDAGYHEIVVTGCNLMEYSSEGADLAHLVADLAELKDDVRIRIGSLEPMPQVEEVLAAMADHGNVCRSVHLSVQSGSDAILEAMKRTYKIAEVDRLVESAEGKMPNLSLGCDMIAGFPGEEAVDHLSSVAFLRRHEFVRVHAFPYSNRPGTAAAHFKDQIHHPVRFSRAKELARIGDINLVAYAMKFRGETVEVIGESHSRFEGWTGEHLKFILGAPGVKVLSCTRTHRKELMKCRVKFAKDGILYGTIASGR